MADIRHESRRSRRAPYAGALVACVLAALLAATLPAAAAQRGSDEIAGSPASEREIDTKRLPNVASEAGIVVDADGTVLWGRTPDSRRAMASITKLMTALVAVENASLDDQVTVGPRASRPGESTAGLRPGSTITLEQLLEALLVKSGNDAAVVVAEHVSGSEEAFVDLMNARAAELGLDDTQFANPHGLDAEGHRSSAADLAVLTQEAMRNPDIRRIVAMKRADVGDIEVENTNRLLGSYPGAIGVKTGFTDDAGYCVIGGAERGGLELYAVVLGASSENERFSDARTLLDWAFTHYRPTSLIGEGTYLGSVPVSDYLDTSVSAVSGLEATATVFDLRGEIERSVELVDEVAAPVEAGSALGTVTFTQDGEEIGSVEIVAARDVEAPTPFERVGIAMTRMWRSLFGPEIERAPSIVEG